MKRLLAVLAIAGSLLFVHRALMAQDLNQRADRKITGQYYLPHSASAYQRAAMEHARTLNYYGQNYKAVPKEITQQHLSEIKRNVDAGKKELAKLKPEAAKDKKLQKPLAAMEAHLANCDEYCQMLTDEAGKRGGSDSEVICDCCEKIASELQAAEAENDKIKEHLGAGKKKK
ncbi:MAG TPA: hypothetical protein VGN42_22690 [Pirellulales bacterium]|jgi:hypothetical protein|nr:hypothetical protein [Pirellulales bacterium]